MPTASAMDGLRVAADLGTTPFGSGGVTAGEPVARKMSPLTTETSEVTTIAVWVVMVVVSGERGEMVVVVVVMVVVVVVVEAAGIERAWLYVEGEKWRRWNGERSLAIWGSFGLRGHVIGGARVPSPSPDLGVTPPRARASPRFAAVVVWRTLSPTSRWLANAPSSRVVPRHPAQPTRGGLPGSAPKWEFVRCLQEHTARKTAACEHTA